MTLLISITVAATAVTIGMTRATHSSPALSARSHPLPSGATLETAPRRS